MKKNNLLIYIGVGMLIMVGIGFFVFGRNKQAGIMPKLPGSNSSELILDCPLNDDELCRYMDKTTKMAADLKSGYTGSSVTIDSAGTKTESAWEIAGDRTHFVTKENGKEISNMITIGNVTYTKDMVDGTWMKFVLKTEGEKTPLAGFDPEELMSQFADTVQTDDALVYKAMGKEVCGSLTCFKYQVVNQMIADPKQYIYFDDKEYIMRKMRMEFANGMVTESTFEFKKVTIEEPSLIKQDQDSEDVGRAPSYDADDLQKAQELIEQMQSSQ
ncbi:MAG: hypothetical protein WC489_00270 [Patescibacteria group bacterium]